ncbi:MAG: 50S ribosomal protein L11 methyltransferase [Anaerolineae bacterium]|nr:50S ribosomal protein L11 methyltransferase [Anaerolineae bacterium]
MDWVEISLEVDGEAAEAVADVLHRYGHQGVVIERSEFPIEVWESDEVPPADRLTVRAYFPNDAQAEDKKQQLREAIYFLSRLYPMPEPTFNSVRDEDWAEAWKAHYHPLRLGRQLYIRPQWREITDPRPDDIVLVLDPGTAFGTGTHPTTQLCLIALEDMLPAHPGVDVIDLGCGSGILGIAAIKLGAGSVLAVDIDDFAVKATLTNAALNDVTAQVTAQQGDLDTLKTTARHFDLLLCNILAKIIIQMAGEGLGDVLRAGGRAIFSGIIDEQADAVEAALRAGGLEPVKRRALGDWVAIEAHKSEA